MKVSTIPLYDTPPLDIGGERPTLTYYRAEQKRGRGTVIICPGGGYAIRAPHEGEGYALFLNRAGLDAFVVDYRVSPNRFPRPLLDARRAVRLVRQRAAEYGIDPSKIAIMGSSAGGHLAALTATYRGALTGEGVDATDSIDPLPNAQILCYPVIDLYRPYAHLGSAENLLGEEQLADAPRYTPSDIADAQTPPAFIWHTAADSCVDVTNSYVYAMALRRLNIPCELHVFPFGPHGQGLADSHDDRDSLYMREWSSLLLRWLQLYGYLN